MIGGEDLYTRYAEKVCRYLFALCGRADTAEELTQETFCRALAGQKEFRGECAPSTWLCAIAKRVWYQELAALEEYLPDAWDTDKGVAPGTPLEVVGWQERGKYLYLFYMADNDQNMHGVVTLEKGWNGKYQPFTAEIEPSNRWGGLYGGQILAGKEGEWLFYLAGYNCREVYSATLDFYLSDQNGEGLGVTTLHLSQMDGEDFFWLWNWEELAGQLELSQGEAARARLMGLVLVRYFLRRD